ncbi:MarR family transcriptional regulator [Bacillus sp. ISL-51]|nr:MarR family transcriptional regulator [Bacillus sp. ISL-51]MBT2635492.1 MarR family transcriptional regulator [Bacillus sp. ISL-26]
MKHISREQLDLLTILTIKGPSSPSSLALIQNVHKSAISNRVKKLIEKGLVEWTDSPNNSDKRSKLIEVTEKGKATKENLDKAIYNAVKKVMDDTDEEHLDSFIEIFTMLKDKFKGGPGE